VLLKNVRTIRDWTPSNWLHKGKSASRPHACHQLQISDLCTYVEL